MRKGQTHSAETREAMSAAQQARRDAEKHDFDNGPPRAGAPDGHGGGQARKPDPPPNARSRGKGGKRRERVADSDLSKTLGKLLSMPALPSKMLLHCDFCTEHFATEGPKAARELVELSRDHEPLRGALEDIYRAYTSITWVGIIGGYVTKPLAHHLVPNHLLAFAQPVLGVPPRDPAARAAGGDGGGAGGVAGMPGMQEAAAELLRTMTPEQIAAMYGLPEDQVLDIYAELGVDPNEVRTNGHTPAPPAGAAGDPDVADDVAAAAAGPEAAADPQPGQ